MWKCAEDEETYVCMYVFIYCTTAFSLCGRTGRPYNFRVVGKNLPRVNKLIDASLLVLFYRYRLWTT